MDLPLDCAIRAASGRDLPLLEWALGSAPASDYRSRLARDGIVLIAYRLEFPVAALHLSWEPADEPDIRQYLADVPLLYRLSVRRDMRGQGIGSALLTAAEGLVRARGLKQVALGLDLGNPRLLAFYERRGYADWGHGLVSTVRETFRPDGSVTREPDTCQVLVKALT